MYKKMYWDDKATNAYVVRKLKQSEVVLSTTDTVLGLMAPLSKKGYNSLGMLKKRVEKPYLIIIADKNCIDYFVTKKSALRIKKLAENFWPGPLTIIVKARSNLPKFIKGSQGKVALRVPAHAALRNVAQPFKGLFSTSANITSRPVPNTLSEVDQHILAHVSAIVIEKKQETTEQKEPSTIIDATGSTYSIVRAGAITKEQLEKVISLS